jgi:glycosyltransferase involved in cell wall biosynthesis
MSPTSVKEQEALPRADRGPSTPTRGPRDLSVIVPVHNEEDNIAPLYAELDGVLAATGLDYEIIFIDDGSTDATLERMCRAVGARRRVRIVELRRNFGQTAALSAGIEHSRGRILVPMDGDMQNDPRDIPRLLAALAGPPPCDIVSGWRKNRRDKWLTRRVPSRIANGLIARVTGVRIHDFGCTLKAYRREVLEDVGFFSELHRFLPALAHAQGARVVELVVHHRPRTRGVTKYGLGRLGRVLLDLVMVKFLGGYMTKPLYFFGRVALASFVFALVLLAVGVLQKYGYFFQPEGLNLNRNVLLTLSALCFFLAVQSVSVGVLAELLVRVYHGMSSRPTYRVRRVIEGERAPDAAHPAPLHGPPDESAR